MKKIQWGLFFQRLYNKKDHFPLNGQIELTYRCNLNCIHCYCKESENREQKTEDRRQRTEDRKSNTERQELTTKEWKKILDVIQKEGCLNLCLTGGDPLVRDDFLEIYSYAKNKGFIITLFTNGQGFTEEIITYLVKTPPYSIEITLNGITKDVYEVITRIEGSYSKIMRTIRRLKEKKLPLILKTNCLKQNKHEVGKIKRWTEKFLGKPSASKHYFKYGPMIYPRFSRDKTPCKHRLSYQELLEVKRQDFDIWEQYQKGLHSDFPDLKRDRTFLYRCNAWMNQFFINPYGRLKFCQFSEKFSVDLKITSFKEGFYKTFPQVLKEQFKTNSKCRDCALRPICYYCPALAFLETGNEEAPVPYYCELAKARVKEQEELKNKRTEERTEKWQ